MAADAVDYDRAPHATAAGRARTAATAALASPPTSSAPATRARSSSPRAARRFGGHESVTLRANRTGRDRPLHRRLEHRVRAARPCSRRCCSEFLGIDYDAITVHAGDTGDSPLNTGAFASRTVIAAAGASSTPATRLRDGRCASPPGVLDVEDPDSSSVVGHGRAASRATRVSIVPLATLFTLRDPRPGPSRRGVRRASRRRRTSSRREAAYSFGTAAAVGRRRRRDGRVRRSSSSSWCTTAAHRSTRS